MEYSFQKTRYQEEFDDQLGSEQFSAGSPSEMDEESRVFWNYDDICRFLQKFLKTVVHSVEPLCLWCSRMISNRR
jgi:hypothetical protein